MKGPRACLRIGAGMGSCGVQLWCGEKPLGAGNLNWDQYASCTVAAGFPVGAEWDQQRLCHSVTHPFGAGTGRLVTSEEPKPCLPSKHK